MLFLAKESRMPATHASIIRKMKLFSVNQLVRSKTHNTIWRVIGKKKIQIRAPDNLSELESQLTSAVYLYYLRIKGGKPGIFKIIGCAYTLQENTFEAYWEVIDQPQK